MACAIALALTLVPLASAAKENGIKIGEGRLHPYFEFQSRYDSLAGYVGEEDGSGTATLVPKGDLVLHFRPGFTLDVPSENVALALAGGVGYELYTGIQNEGTREQSKITADVDLGATINPDGAVLVAVGNHFVRSDRTSVLALGVGTISDFDQARLKIGIQPGGKALVVEPGYTLTFEHFEEENVTLPVGCTPGDPTCDPGAASALDYLQHTAHLDARYKFLPKTAFVFDSSLAYRGYLSDAAGNLGSANLKVMLGLAGLLTTKVAITAKAGWGDQLAGSGYKSVIGQLEAAYLFSEQAQLRLGYVRTFEPNPGAALYYRDDRGYLDARALVAGKLTLHGDASYDHIAFGDGRVDDQFRFGAGPDYEITSWLNGGIGYAITHRTSSQDLVGFTFTRHEAYLRLQVIY